MDLKNTVIIRGFNFFNFCKKPIFNSKFGFNIVYLVFVAKTIIHNLHNLGRKQALGRLLVLTSFNSNGQILTFLVLEIASKQVFKRFGSIKYNCPK